MSSQYRNTFGQQYLIIAVNGVAVLSGVFLLNGIIARLFGIEVLGEFLLIKRTVTTVVSILLIGLNIGIPYFLNRESEESVYRNSVLIFILFTLPAIAMFVVLIRAGFTEGFQINHVLGYGLYTIGICMQFFVYAHYRGRHKFFWASLLQLSATAIVPVIIVNFTDDIQQVLAVIGLVNSLLSGILLILLYRGLPYGNYQLERIKIYMKYGLVRFPSFISQFILLAGPGILASSWATYKDVALVNGNMSLIRLLLFILGPIGIIMLPRVSGIKHQQQKDKLGYSLAGLLQITTGIAMIIAAFLYIFNGKILTLWYSLDRTEILPEAKIIILALPFYVIAEILRSPIDGLSYKGINSKVYGLAAIGFLISFFMMNTTMTPIGAIGSAFVLGYIICSILMLYFINKILPMQLSPTQSIPWLFAGLPYIVVLKYFAITISNNILSIFIGGLTCMIMIALVYLIHRENLNRYIKMINEI